MKRTRISAALALLLIPLAAGAEERAKNAGFSSSSSSSSTSTTDANGNTVTVTTTERDGKRETRRTVTTPGGKVVAETKENGDGKAADDGEKPAAQQGKAGGPWLGVHTAELPAAMREQLDLRDGEGLLVEQLSPDSPAGSAGIAQHDIILTFNLTPVSTPDELRRELSNRQPGEKVLIEYLHKSRRQKAAVTLGKRAGNAQPEQQAKDAEPVAKVDNQQGKAAAQQGKLPDFPALPKIPGFPDLSKLPGANGNVNSNTTTTSSSSSFSRTVIVGPDGKTRVIENKNGGDPIEQMLRDPNVPETMKESLRKMRQQMREFEGRAGEKAPDAGNNAPAKRKAKDDDSL